MTTIIGTIIGLKRNHKSVRQYYAHLIKRAWELMCETWKVLGEPANPEIETK